MAKTPKYYFRTEEDEFCYTLDYHLRNAKEEGLTEIELFEAKPQYIEGFFWCRVINDSGEDGSCGKKCIDYEPKNGKSGICKHKSNTFKTQGKKVMFKVNSVKQRYEND